MNCKLKQNVKLSKRFSFFLLHIKNLHFNLKIIFLSKRRKNSSENLHFNVRLTSFNLFFVLFLKKKQRIQFFCLNKKNANSRCINWNSALNWKSVEHWTQKSLTKNTTFVCRPDQKAHNSPNPKTSFLTREETSIE